MSRSEPRLELGKSFRTLPMALVEQSRHSGGVGSEAAFVSGLKTEGKKEAARKIVEGVSAMAELFGRGGVEELIQSLQTSGTVTLEAIQHIQETIPTCEEFKQTAMNALEEDGIVRRQKFAPLLVDVERMRTFSVPRLRSVLATQHDSTRFEPYLKYGIEYALHTIFKDEKQTLSFEDAKTKKRGELESKPLFYFPENDDAALDREKIRQAKFYLGTWEIHPAGFGEKRGETNHLFPGLSLKMNEATIAAILYHPRFGDGHRDERGMLLVRRQNKEKAFVRVSGNWFKDEISYLGGEQREPGSSLFTPEAYVQQHCPNLEERGLLKSVDFRSAERRLSPKGYVMFNGVLHTFGTKFGGMPAEQVSDREGLLTEIDKAGKPVRKWKIELYQPGDPGLVQVNFGKGEKRWSAGADMKKMMELVASDSSEQLSDDGFTRELRAQAKIRLSDLGEGERQCLQSIAGTPGKKKEIIAFARKFGLDGVRALGNAGEDETRAKTLMHLSEKVGPQIAEEVIHRYGTLLHVVDKEAKEVVGMFSKQAGKPVSEEKVRVELMRRAQGALKMFLEDIQKDPKMKLDQVLLNLDRLREDIVVFASLFKTAYKGKEGEVDFAQFEKFELVTSTPAELSKPERKRDRDQMEEILRGNRKGQDIGVAIISARSLREKLNPKNAKTQFYLLRDKSESELIAFVRFDERPDLGKNALYAGSLNVHPAWRGSAIGKSFFGQIVDQEAKEHKIFAHAAPDTEVGTSYVEDNEFVITGVDSFDGTDLLAIERDDTKGTTRRARGASQEVKAFDISKPYERAAFLAFIKKAQRAGQVCTRYFISDPSHLERRHIGGCAPAR